MLLRNLSDARELLYSVKGVFAGVGMTAFSRIAPAYFLNSYSIVSLRRTRDLLFLREKARIFCLEEELGGVIREKGLNSAVLLAHSLAREFIKGLPNPGYLLVYQNYPLLETLARQEGWFLLANPSALRLRVTDRSFFYRMVNDLSLPVIPGGIQPVKELWERDYQYWAETLGPEFVVQLPDVTQGGGRGTFFVRSPRDYTRLRERLRNSSWREISLKSVSFHRYINGIPVSVTLCVTTHGILLTGIQTQLIDLPYCENLPEDGVFCGHVWDDTPWPSSITGEARRQARAIGTYLAALGYKGILGIDFLIDKSRERIFPLEINPRLTGAFPMLSLLHIRNGTIPLEAFHMLEFLNVPYQVDVEDLNARYEEPLRGSHVLLFLLSNEKRTMSGGLDAGLYDWERERETFSFVRGAIDYHAFENDRQFVVVDGPPDTGGKALASSDPLHRLCRLLFPYPVVDENGILEPPARRAIEWAYGQMGKLVSF